MTARNISIGNADILTDQTAKEITDEFCKRVKLCGDRDPDGLCK